MKHEILRLDHVTYVTDGIAQLDNVNFHMFQGEIRGILPINTMGLEAFAHVLQHNPPLHYGQVYFREKLVNHHRSPSKEKNNVMIIGQSSALLPNLSALENVCVFGSPKHTSLIHNRKNLFIFQILEQCWGVKIDPKTPAFKLSPFDKIIISLMRASIAAVGLVVIQEISHKLSPQEIYKLQQILDYMVKRNQSFLYVCSIPAQLAKICQHVSIMSNGRILKSMESKYVTTQLVQSISNQVQLEDKPVYASFSSFTNISPAEPYRICTNTTQHEVFPGVCKEWRYADRMRLSTFIQDLTAGHPKLLREIQCGSQRHHRFFLSSSDIGLISLKPYQSLIFPNFDVVDNLLCKVPTRLLLTTRLKTLRQSVVQENCMEIRKIAEKGLNTLSIFETYSLIFHRVLLQNPKIVFLQQPFWGTDIMLQEHIVELCKKLLQRNIAVIVLSTTSELRFPLADEKISSET